MPKFFKKKLTTLSVALVTVFALMFSPVAIAAESQPVEGDFTLTIMHVNDTHARTHLFPKVYTAIKEVRAENPDALLLHAGDAFSGTLYFNEFKGQADLALMNEMGFDAMVYGNHEFDLGINEEGHKSLAEFVKNANFPVLGSNIDFSKDPFMAELADGGSLVENAQGGKSYFSIVKEIDGEKVGIFGLTTEDTKNISSPMNVIFNNYLETAEKAVKEFEDKGINKIVALTHLGYNNGNKAFGDDLLLAQVDGIDIIVGGHSHSKLEEPVVINIDAEGKEKDPTVIVQASQYVEYLGKLEVSFDDNGVVVSHAGELIGGVKDMSADENLDNVLKPYKDKVEQKMNEKIGATAVKELTNPRFSDGDSISVRANETELGNLITDAMLARVKKNPEFADTVIAFQNGGGIRAAIPAGDITAGQVIAVLPFGNDPVVATLTGAEIKEVLETSVKNAPNENGGFLHVSGMRFVYDSTLEVGNRVLKMEVNINGEYVDIEEDKEYRITTNSFTGRGGDGYDVFAKAYNDGRVTQTGEIDWQQLADYMAEDLNGVVDPKIEGRIIDLKGEELPGEDDSNNEENPTQPGNEEDPVNDEGTGTGEDEGTGSEGDETNKETEEGAKLPNTSVDSFTMLLLGSIMTVIGGVILIVRRRLSIQ
ncbi:bifunctional metallophosphatase/5'-nucleotidase [Bacillus kwashiorkori]|uniref:bifunctional metallophosphatase/5'-nucleotidase n=1 Tax=Bacillus kwashiorkori TaxID=1522318 RepID=UPI000783880A|nr:5'-nucleotidase C-terminal domain-containing protein [Bacillus kwashiorkori]